MASFGWLSRRARLKGVSIVKESECAKCGHPMPCAHHKPENLPMTGERLLDLAVVVGVVDMQNMAKPYWEKAMSPLGRKMWNELAMLVVEEMKP